MAFAFVQIDRFKFGDSRSERLPECGPNNVLAAAVDNPIVTKSEDSNRYKLQ